MSEKDNHNLSENDFDAMGEDEIVKLTEEVKNNLEGWKRTQADFLNYKRRVENERSETAALFKAEAVRSFLPAIENFERAVENVPKEVLHSPWFSGFKMLQSSFEKALKDNSIEIYGQVGEEFDPNIHEALASEPGPLGQITRVMNKGYKMGSRILREASVVVGQG